MNDSVEDIDLSHNQLSYIPKIGGKSTFKLNLSHNSLRSCRLQTYFPNLCVLDLSNQPGDIFGDDFAESLVKYAPTLEVLIVNKVNATDLSFANHPRLKAI